LDVSTGQNVTGSAANANAASLPGQVTGPDDGYLDVGEDPEEAPYGF